MRNKLGFVILGSTLLIVALVPIDRACAFGPDGPPRTQWLSGSGDWHDGANWDNGIPDETTIAEVNTGSATFDSAVDVLLLAVAQSRPLAVNQVASVNGTADLTSRGELNIGALSGTGNNVTRDADGELIVSNGNITVSPHIEFGMIDSGGYLAVGVAGGTGTNNVFTGHGHLELVDGSISAGVLEVGSASGTGSATGNAVGSLSITNGDISLYSVDEFGSFLTVGVASGASLFRGNANGRLTVVNGSVAADQIDIGRISGGSQTTLAADGVMELTAANLNAGTLTIGVAQEVEGMAVGRYEQFGGTTQVGTMTQGIGGSIILGIGGPQGSTAFSQIVADSAEFAGTVEVRFVDGFQPRAGDTFPIITTGELTGDFTLAITGIDLSQFPNLTVERSSLGVVISMPIPEPKAMLGMTLCAAVMVGFFRTRSRRMNPRNGETPLAWQDTI